MTEYGTNVITDEGLRLSDALFRKIFSAKRHSDAASGRRQPSFDGAIQRPSSNVRYAPKSDRLLHCREMTLWAMNGLPPCTKAASIFAFSGVSAHMRSRSLD
jgi:hypothetical protein